MRHWQAAGGSRGKLSAAWVRLPPSTPFPHATMPATRESCWKDVWFTTLFFPSITCPHFPPALRKFFFVRQKIAISLGKIPPSLQGSARRKGNFANNISFISRMSHSAHHGCSHPHFTRKRTIRAAPAHYGYFPPSFHLLTIFAVYGFYSFMV